MCGIIGYIGPKDVVPILVEGLKRLEYRGYDSAGIAVVDENRIHLKRAKGKISDLEKSLGSSSLDGNFGVGHTRWATHGRPSEENAHPHRDCTGSLVVVHNGIIENYLLLKKKLIEEGHTFQTETDTEVIAHLIEKYFHGSLEEAVQQVVPELEGAYAVAAISTKDVGKIVVAKVGPPAVVGMGEGEYFVSSDLNPLLSHTQKIVFLEDGEIAVLDSGGVKFLSFQGQSLKKEVERLSWSPLMVEKSGFKHFMLKEIFEQPQVVRDTLKGRASLDSGMVFLEEMGIDPQALKKIKKVVIIACGTSYHAGLLAKSFIETLARIPVDVEYASEYRYKDFILDKDSLVVVISQSGETADSLAALRAAKKQKPQSLAVCNVVKSSIARTTDGVLYTHAGPEIGVAATKTFSAQMAALALLALYLAQIKGEIDEKASLPLIEDLQRIPHKMEKILNRAKEIEDLAREFVSFSHFLYLGRGINFPVALEGALKLKEISYIHAEGYPGGEMKHGPIALIDEKMPTMTVIPKDKVYEKMLSNISEIKTRVGYILAVAFEDDEEIQEKVDRVISIPSANPLFTPFLTTLPLQLFAYYIAAKRGADVDQPRNLAKSVTVE
ncbi:MAG: glutamine--fructose-6-phosphate transaminase (isomerizing) [Candidatus Aminicenantes bacterium]|nr:MAG: glutamine--fructose-6-phosphate transaminase (isomerizing) [Candidatus Aminicenantes bacterium]